jgi:hypothetical protein
MMVMNIKVIAMVVTTTMILIVAMTMVTETMTNATLWITKSKKEKACPAGLTRSFVLWILAIQTLRSRVRHQY